MHVFFLVFGAPFSSAWRSLFEHGDHGFLFFCTPSALADALTVSDLSNGVLQVWHCVFLLNVTGSSCLSCLIPRVMLSSGVPNICVSSPDYFFLRKRGTLLV